METNDNDLNGQEAIDKMKELVDDNSICMFTSAIGETPLQTRPMTTQAVDDAGNFWFFSPKSSHKNYEIRSDARVQLLFANTSASEFLTVYGRANVLEDREKIAELWSPMAKAWFEKGKDDPDISLIKVVPENAYYWEPKYNKMVTLLKIAGAAVTGKGSEVGEQGKLKV